MFVDSHLLCARAGTWGRGRSPWCWANHLASRHIYRMSCYTRNLHNRAVYNQRSHGSPNLYTILYTDSVPWYIESQLLQPTPGCWSVPYWLAPTVAGSLLTGLHLTVFPPTCPVLAWWLLNGSPLVDSLLTGHSAHAFTSLELGLGVEVMGLGLGVRIRGWG